MKWVSPHESHLTCLQLCTTVVQGSAIFDIKDHSRVGLIFSGCLRRMGRRRSRFVTHVPVSKIISKLAGGDCKGC
jgi:hypothetical protein